MIDRTAKHRGNDNAPRTIGSERSGMLVLVGAPGIDLN